MLRPRQTRFVALMKKRLHDLVFLQFHHDVGIAGATTMLFPVDHPPQCGPFP